LRRPPPRAQAFVGHDVHNQAALAHGGQEISLWRYVTGSDFGNAVVENWQSEFLAVGSFAALAIYLRQRGSPESKPVGAPHDATGIEG
jgi:hypothetical protein